MSDGTATTRTSGRGIDQEGIGALTRLDHREIDWGRVRKTAYLIHQHYRYEYPGPIRDLRQRLVIVPPERFGDQRRIVHRLEVSDPDARTATSIDAFGNTVIVVEAPYVEAAIDFEAWIVVERSVGQGPRLLPGHTLSDPGLRDPTPRTTPDAALRRAAAEIAASNDEGLALAARINHWTYEALRYAHEVTDIHTSVAEALELGRGVCQDYAHIMLTLCRLCGLAARYVSGHLLGEGGTHAWVEVVLPADGAVDSDGAGDADKAVAWPFDPTHDRRAGLGYVTVAVGRDYGDVAPTSGTYTASYPGQLSARKRVDLTSVEYGPAEPLDE